MFNLFKKTTDLFNLDINEKDKDQVSEIAWDSIIKPMDEKPEPIFESGLDLIFGVANDMLESTTK